MNGGAGKGDKRRPMQVKYETYSDNWDRAFGRKKKSLDKKTKGK
jgi:hypothetical protein